MIERQRSSSLIAALAAIFLTLPAAGQQTMRLDADNRLMLREIGVVAALQDGELRVISRLPGDHRSHRCVASADASLRGGDALLMMNGERLSDLEAARATYDAVAVGDEVKLAVRRDERRFLVSFLKRDPAELEQGRVVLHRMTIGGGENGDIRPILGLSIVARADDGRLSVATKLPIAETALADGDLIRRIAGEEVTSLDQLEALVEAAAVGATLEVVVERGGARTVLEIEKQETRGKVMVRGERDPDPRAPGAGPDRDAGARPGGLVLPTNSTISTPSSASSGSRKPSRSPAWDSSANAACMPRSWCPKRCSTAPGAPCPKPRSTTSSRSWRCCSRINTFPYNRAVKYQSGASKRVRLRLENTSGGGAELRHLMDVDEQLFEAMRPDVVHDVYVSLANDDGAIISRPYEAKLEELRYGAPATLEFGLLQDLDALTVLLTFGQGSQRSVKVFLQKDASVDRVVVQSEQFSQEVELGGSAEFDLTLELFSGDTDTFQLAVADLPSEGDQPLLPGSRQRRPPEPVQVHREHPDPAGRSPGLPARPRCRRGHRRPADPVLGAGDPAPSGRRARRPRAADLGRRDDRRAQDRRGPSRAGAARSRRAAGQGAPALLPDPERRDRGRRDRADQRRHPPARQHRGVRQPAPGLGRGDRAGPWCRLSRSARKRRWSCASRPSAEAPVGKYEIRIRSTSFSDNQPIEGEDKTVTVEIRPRVRIAPSAILVATMVLLILGVVVAGVRLARR